jgi:hypothetical protein
MSGAAMKTLAFTLTLFASTQVLAGNWIPTGKPGASTTYWEKQVCEEKEASPCDDYTGCPLDECSIQTKQVDDPNKPILSETEKDEHGFPKVIGYEKMSVTKPWPDSAKLAAKDAAAAAEKAKADAIQAAKDRMKVVAQKPTMTTIELTQAIKDISKILGL